MSQCKSCGAEIVWIEMKKTGKAMPCDAATVRVVTDVGETVDGHVSHFQTCPDADKHRRKPS